MILKLWLALCLAFTLCASQATEAEKTLSAQEIAQLQARMHDLEKELQAHRIKQEVFEKVLEVQRASIDTNMYRYSNLIAEQGKATAWIGNLVAGVAVLITVLLFAGTLATYVSTKDRAKKEASSVAKKWFSKKTHHLEQEIEQLLAKAEAAQQSIASHADKVVTDAQNASKVMEEAKAEAVAFMQLSSTKDASGALTGTDAQTTEFVQQANESLKSKPEKDFTADEHYIRGAALYHGGSLQGALDSFEAAISHSTDASSADQVKYQMAKAFTLDALHRHDESNATYDAIDQRYASDPSYGVREQVATGLFNKAVSLSDQGKLDPAIAAYDYLDTRFGNDTSPEVREQVAKGMLNKGYKLGKLGKIEEEIATYDDIGRRFTPEQAPTLRENLVRALNKLGVTKIMAAKSKWKDVEQHRALLSDATTILERALSHCVRQDHALVRSDQNDRAQVSANLGYCLFLAGEQDAAREPTLTSLKLGGEELLEYRRAAANLRRIEPEDSEYEAMLDQLWAVAQ